MSTDTRAGHAQIQGHCEPGFEPVLEAFIANVEARDEVGASVCGRSVARRPIKHHFQNGRPGRL